MNRPRLLVVINQGDGSGQCRSAITIAKLLSLGLRPNGSRQDIDLSNKMEEQSAEPNQRFYAIRTGGGTPKLLWGAQENANTTLQRNSRRQASVTGPAVEFSALPIARLKGAEKKADTIRT